MQVCDAELNSTAGRSWRATHAARDTKTKSGKTVTIAIASPAIAESLTIQEVSVTEIGTIKGAATQ